MIDSFGLKSKHDTHWYLHGFPYSSSNFCDLFFLSSSLVLLPGFEIRFVFEGCYKAQLHRLCAKLFFPQFSFSVFLNKLEGNVFKSLIHLPNLNIKEGTFKRDFCLNMLLIKVLPKSKISFCPFQVPQFIKPVKLVI